MECALATGRLQVMYSSALMPIRVRRRHTCKDLVLDFVATDEEIIFALVSEVTGHGEDYRLK